MGYLGGFGGTEQLGAMSVDEASADATNNNITAYVRNIGKTTIKLDVCYVDGNNATISTDPGDLAEGEVGKVVIDYTMSAGKTYEVKLIAEDNTQVSFSVKAD
jgi:archaellum component FlaG (FlaF/FlaG flagellin family)